MGVDIWGNVLGVRSGVAAASVCIAVRVVSEGTAHTARESLQLTLRR